MNLSTPTEILNKARPVKYVRRERRGNMWIYWYKSPHTGQLRGRFVKDAAVKTMPKIEPKPLPKPVSTPPVPKAPTDIAQAKVEKKVKEPAKPVVKPTEVRNYINEKPSDVGNIGEDVLGAARHNFDTYDVEQIEKAGMGRKLVTKKQLVGEYKLERDEWVRRMAGGETLGKLAAEQMTYKLLAATPPDNPEDRKKYYNFIRHIEQASANSKTAGEYHELLMSSIDPNYDAKKGTGQIALAGEFFGYDKVIGQKLQSFIVMDFSLTSGHMITADLMRLDERIPEGTSEKVIGTVFDKMQYKLDKIGIDVKGIVKIKKGDVVSKVSKEPNITFERDLNIYRSNLDKINVLSVEIETFRNKHKITNGMPEKGTELYEQLSELMRKKRTLGGLKEVKLSDTGTVGKVSKGRYQVVFKSETGNEVIKYLGRDDLNLVNSADRGKNNKKGIPILFTRGKVERKGGTEITGTAQEQQQVLHKGLQLRALQYGNSMTDNERVHHTEWTLASFNDLSDITGIPVNKLSMNGRLAMAFGARGVGAAAGGGGAVAHYEPLDTIINMTRSEGFGSLAHEWGHFLDHIVGKTMTSRKEGYASISGDRINIDPATVKSSKDLPDGTIIEIRDRRYYYDAGKTAYPFKRLKKGEMSPSSKTSYLLYSFRGAKITAPNPDSIASRFKAVSDKLYDKMEGSLQDYRPYWSRKQELFARAFECYVTDKLDAMNRKNTYLASTEKTIREEAKDVYPQGDFRKEINTDIDKLMQAVVDAGVLEKAAKMYEKELRKTVIKLPSELRSKGLKNLGYLTTKKVLKASQVA